MVDIHLGDNIKNLSSAQKAFLEFFNSYRRYGDPRVPRNDEKLEMFKDLMFKANQAKVMRQGYSLNDQSFTYQKIKNKTLTSNVAGPSNANEAEEEQQDVNSDCDENAIDVIDDAETDEGEPMEPDNIELWA